MRSISAVGGSPQDVKQLKKLQKRENEPTSSTHQTAPTSHAGQTNGPAHQPLTAQQAEALRLLTFAGKNHKSGQAARLEKDFLYTLKHTKDHTEKASVANLLGRAHSVAATPHLLKLLDEKHPVQVRTAAASALANIGSSTDADGYTAPELSQALWDTYQARKAHLQKEIEEPGDLSYDEKLKREEDHEARFDEISALVHGVSQLDVVRHNKALLTEFRTRLAVSQMKEAVVQELSSNKDVAEEAFHKSLQERYRKPIKEILKGIPSDELKELKKGVIVASPDGKEMNLLEMTQQIEQLKRQQEQFDLKLVGTLMDALSHHDDKEVNSALKMGLESEHHSIRSRALDALTNRNTLNYSTDVYPHLNASHPEVRQSAIQALLNSPEPAAKQKTLEMISPSEFFNCSRGVSRESMGQYVSFLSELATRGDEYIDALSSRVVNHDFNMESRQMGLQVLGMMAREPIAHLVSPQTSHQARTVLKVMALSGSGKTSADKAAIATSATSLWVHTKDPAAIQAAILLADAKEFKTTGKDQERLLSSVMSVLTKDAESRSKSTQDSDLAGNVLDIMKAGKNALLTDSAEADIRAHLKPQHVQKALDADSDEEFAEENEKLGADPSLADKLAPSLTALRPALLSLAESDKSLGAQSLAFRIMGLLKDKETVRYLMDRVNQPLKDQFDWKAPLSYRGNPSMDALRIRLNAVQALGDIGDAEAIKVMTPLLEDSNLRRAVSEPLSKLAPEANKNASEAQLKSVRTKLTKLMADPDTGRGMRAVRMRAANALYQFNGGVDALKDFAANTKDPNFKRHVLSALISNNHGLEPEHADHHLVKDMIHPGLGVDRLHARGITGKGVEMAIVDGGYVDEGNKEAFQSRVKLPAQWDGNPESEHPTMVMSTAAGNGKLKGVAPDAKVYSDKWPAFDSSDPMDVYKKMIEGKMRGENNIRVINNSWGFSNQNVVLHKDVRTILKEFKNVVDMAEKAGIQIVFAAGNEGEEPAFPGLGTMTLFGLDVDKLTDDQKRNYNYILDKVITVGAVNTQGSDKRADHRMAEFSSRGDSTRSNMLKPTVIAPGADMMVYSWDKHKGNPKTLVNGTSFASPYVSGLLALMCQVDKANVVSPKEVREILQKSSVRLAGVPVSQQGCGEVSPEAAVKMMEELVQSKTSGKHIASAPSAPSGPSNPPTDAPNPETTGDGDVEMADANASAASARTANAGHKRSWGLFQSGQGADQDSAGGPVRHKRGQTGESKSHRTSGQPYPGVSKPGHKGSKPKAPLSFSGSGKLTDGVQHSGAFSQLGGLLSGKSTPSSASSPAFNQALAEASRMNPPKAPVLDIIR